MIVFILLLLLFNCINARSGRYECGPHGNFEYCIEGFPGCVVGCHCFPGYYFDTDTKICEPSMKLTQDFRRHYAMGTEPQPEVSNAPTRPTPSSTPHVLEAHVDEIAKDTGDLSDWLYNQFFKTIENQVINKTDDDELLKGTRRSGGTAKRKTKKKGKKRKSFKKSTKRGLRRKLLRISEDDSMFDSDSDSDSRTRSDSGTWESWEEDMGTKDGDEKDGDKDRDHGHRKIVVYSKQPKPALPSFIFLPNVETPFYPPIGLPAPPMPMYPMIPVPPIIPAQVYVNSSTGNETTTTTTESTPPTTTSQTETEKPTTSEKTTTTAVEDTTTAVEDNTNKGSGERKALRSASRKKLLQRLRDKKNQEQIIKGMGPMGGRLRKSKNNHFIDQDPSMFASDNLFQLPIQEETRNPEKDDGALYDDDVDFKYLTQLIHRVDANQSTPLPAIQFAPSRTGSIKDLKAQAMYRKLNKHSITPGRLQAGIPTRRRFDDCSSRPDDTYYSNLGRQIASLIRGISPDIVSEVNIDIDRMNSKTEPFLSENSFAPRSYWERFVRSPLRVDLGHFSKYEDSKGSNEKLFDLENKVEVAASSPPVLTLQELENVISAMNKVQRHVQIKQDKGGYYKPSKSSLNVSLLPRSKSKPTEVPNKRSNEIIINDFLNMDAGNVFDKKGVASRHYRLNKPSIINQIKSNLTNDKPFFNKHKLKDLSSKETRDNFHLTSPRVDLKTNIINAISPNPKYQPSQINFNRSNVNDYYSNNKNNLRAVTRKPYTYYVKPKPTSYFFNEFDFFVKRKK